MKVAKILNSDFCFPQTLPDKQLFILMYTQAGDNPTNTDKNNTIFNTKKMKSRNKSVKIKTKIKKNKENQNFFHSKG